MAAMLKFYLCSTALGWVGLAVSMRGLRATTLPRSSRDEALREVIAMGAAEPASDADIGRLPGLIQALARGQRADGDTAIDWDGLSPFRRAVLEETMRIPAGETRSYGWLARQVGHPRAARAVGRVMATNPLPLVVPCHRVLAANGSLGGYGGGLPLKKALLRAEGAR
ncbi:MAG: MGMT family protein [Dehalococcoidia bacterium]